MVWAHKGSDEQAFTTTQNVRLWHKASIAIVIRALSYVVGELKQVANRGCKWGVKRTTNVES